MCIVEDLARLLDNTAQAQELCKHLNARLTARLTWRSDPLDTMSWQQPVRSFESRHAAKLRARLCGWCRYYVLVAVCIFARETDWIRGKRIGF